MASRNLRLAIFCEGPILDGTGPEGRRLRDGQQGGEAADPAK